MFADVIIPVGHYHRDIVHEAIDSAGAQSVPCNVIVVEDTQRRGQAWARNQGVKQGSAPFVVFLDADDRLHPHFVEHTLLHYQPGTYVYTDWVLDGVLRHVDECQNYFDAGMYHLVTTLLPRRAFEFIGGFDETLPTLEDEDFYYQLQAIGCCAKRLPEPLVDYRRTLGASLVNGLRHGQAARDAVMQQMNVIFESRYGSYRRFKPMCNCGTPQGDPPAADSPAPGEILVRAVYSPSTRIGPATNKKYKRAGLGDMLYVHQADVQARPEWWRPIVKPEAISPDIDFVQQLAREAVGG